MGDEGELPLTTLRSPKGPSENEEKRENLLREKGPGEAMGLNLSQLFKRGTRPVHDSSSYSFYMTSSADLMKNS